MVLFLQVFPIQKLFQLVLRAYQPVTGYTIFTEQFCFTPAGYRDYRPATRCNYCHAPFSTLVTEDRAGPADLPGIS